MYSFKMNMEHGTYFVCWWQLMYDVWYFWRFGLAKYNNSFVDFLKHLNLYICILTAIKHDRSILGTPDDNGKVVYIHGFIGVCLLSELTRDHLSPLYTVCSLKLPWWRNQMEIFSALLALCQGNSPVTGEFPSQRPVTRSSDIFFDLRLNKMLSTQSRRRWFETPSRPLWRHCNG